MNELSLVNLARLAEAANQDPDFCAFAQRFRGTVCIVCGSEARTLQVSQGRITAVAAGDDAHAPIRLVGEPAAWQAIWQGLPGGLHRAWRHRLIQFQGDPEQIFTNWKMIWRLGDLMRAVLGGI